MTDIHAIIAAAKRWREVGGPSAVVEYSAWRLLQDHAIAMAEALVSADRFLAEGRSADAALVIGDCLDKIVKEANRG